MAFNTGNPVPSTAAKDLSDNAENFDGAVNLLSDTWVDRLAVTRDTVNGRIKKMGYTVPIAYTSGIVFTVNDNVKTVEEAGVVYAPLPSALPFTTTNFGADAAKFFVIQGVTEFSQINDLSLPYVFDTVAAMVASTIVFPVGKTLRTTVNNLISNDGGASYIVTAGASPESVGSPDINGIFHAKINQSGWVTPEQYGTDGTAATDSLVLIAYISNARKQLWKSGVTYILDSAITGNTRSWSIPSDTLMIGYGAIIDVRGVGNNGFFFAGPGSLFRIKVAGFRFINSQVNSAMNAMFSEAFLNYVIIEDNVSVGIGQYTFGLGTSTGGYNNLTIRNNKCFSQDPNGDNEFSLCFELFPEIESKHLLFYGNLCEQTGEGGCFKIHTCTDSDIHSNVFIRTLNINGSGSQAVMLGGRPTLSQETHQTRFYNNRISDANTTLGALFLGNKSDTSYVHNNIIENVGGLIYVGGDITDSEIRDNAIQVGIFSLIATVSDITNLLIDGNSVPTINFRDGISDAPNTISSLTISNNTDLNELRLKALTSSSKVRILQNTWVSVTVLGIIDTDDTLMSGNNLQLSDSGNASTQFFNITGTDFKSKKNNFHGGSGGITQAYFMSGSTDALTINDTNENIVRSFLDGGTGTIGFHNMVKALGGSWSVV